MKRKVIKIILSLFLTLLISQAAYAGRENFSLIIHRLLIMSTTEWKQMKEAQSYRQRMAIYG